MDRLQEWGGLHDLTGEEGSFYTQPVRTILRPVLLDTAPESSGGVAPMLRLNAQMGYGHAA